MFVDDPSSITHSSSSSAAPQTTCQAVGVEKAPCNTDGTTVNSAGQINDSGVKFESSKSSLSEVTYLEYVGSIVPKFDIIRVLDNRPNKGTVCVVKANTRQEAQRTVLKVFPKSSEKEYVLERRRREADTHQRASYSRHPHITAFIARHEFPLSFAIEMELCDCGDLTDLPASTSSFQRLELVRQIATALRHLHTDLSLVHVDLKPGNVGLSSLSNGNLIAKLIDFGSAKSPRNRRKGVSFGGTSRFKAPETFQNGEGGGGKFFLGPALDIWSLGVILLYLFTGSLPWQIADRSDSNFRHFQTCMRSRADDTATPIPLPGVKKPLPGVFYQHLIPGMLDPMPDNRYSADTLVRIIEQFLSTQNSTRIVIDGIEILQRAGKAKGQTSSPRVRALRACKFA